MRQLAGREDPLASHHVSPNRFHWWPEQRRSGRHREMPGNSPSRTEVENSNKTGSGCFATKSVSKQNEEGANRVHVLSRASVNPVE